MYEPVTRFEDGRVDSGWRVAVARYSERRRGKAFVDAMVHHGASGNDMKRLRHSVFGKDLGLPGEDSFKGSSTAQRPSQHPEGVEIQDPRTESRAGCLSIVFLFPSAPETLMSPEEE